MTVIGEAYIEVKPESSKFGDEAERGVLGSVGGIAKKAAGIMAGAFAVGGALSFGKDILASAEEATKGLAQTEAVIKSTGGAANVTNKEIGSLTDEISGFTAVEDDAIRQGANLLLTFTNVKNEVGDGNDIFNQATSTMVDMAAAMGTDVKGGAIQLGKALNDPVAGITALTRVGVTFTDQQKDQIAAMVEAGDVAGAQKVILAELNKEFGGSARAQATAADHARIKWGEFKEELGLKLMPVVAAVATFLADKVPAAAEKVFGVLGRVGAVITGLFNLFAKGDFTGGLGRALGIEEDSQIVAVLFSVRDAFLNVIGFVRDTVLPIAGQLVGFVRDNMGPVLAGLGAVVLAVVVPAFLGWAAGAAAAAVATLAAAAPAIALGAAIALLVGGLVYAYQHFEVFRDVVQTVVGVVVAVVSGFVDVVLGLWHTFGDEILAAASAIWSQIQLVVTTAINLVMGVIKFVLAVIQGDWGAAWDAIVGILNTVWEFIKGTISNGIELIKAYISAGLSILEGLWDNSFGKLFSVVSDAFRRIVEAVSNGIGDVIGFVTELPGRILGALGNVGRMLYDAGLAIMRGLRDGIVAGFEAVKDFVGGIAGKIISLKGPLDYDKRMLIPAGRAIMDSLNRGMADREAALKARLRALTQTLAAVGSDPATSPASSAASGSAVPAALLAEIRTLVAAVAALAQQAGGSGTWNLTGTDPVAVGAVIERSMNWGAAG